MKIEIDKVIDHGTLNSEKVILNVNDNTNLKYFILADTTFLSNGNISNKLRHMHWFNEQEVQTGDIVELYTKVGTNGNERLANGHTKYIRYWNLESFVWNNDGDGAILFNATSWNSRKAKGV